MLSLRLLALRVSFSLRVIRANLSYLEIFCNLSSAKPLQAAYKAAGRLASVLQAASLARLTFCHGADGDPPAAETT